MLNLWAVTMGQEVRIVGIITSTLSFLLTRASQGQRQSTLQNTKKHIQGDRNLFNSTVEYFSCFQMFVKVKYR